MRTVTAEEAVRDWRTVATTAEREPLRVTGEGLPEVVVLSHARHESYRRATAEKLLTIADEIGAEAERRGLTPEKLDQILADKS